MDRKSQEPYLAIGPYLLSLLIVVNTAILEDSVTVNPAGYWWLLITLPLLLFIFWKTRPYLSS